MRLWKISCAVLGIGAALVCKVSLAGQAEDLAAGSDDHVVAALSFSEGHNLDSRCDYFKDVYRVTLYADGRVTEVSSVQGTACGPEGELLQRGHLGSPHESRIPAERLPRLLESLRQAHQDAQARMSQEPSGSGEDQAARAQAKLFSIAVSDDEQGSLRSLDLPHATDVSDGSPAAWQRVIAEIRELEVN